MNYYLGIGSGGTKTEFTLADQNGCIAGRSRMGATYFRQVGTPGLVENLTVGIDELLRTSQVSRHNIHRAFVGLVSYDEIQADMAAMNGAVEQALQGIQYAVGGDNRCAWAGSLGGGPGCNVAAGTGSIAYAQNQQGDSARCGGWGHWFGADEGSAYWIGCQFILAFTRQSDGREPKTPLYQAVKEHYCFQTDFDILNLVVNSWDEDRSKVATLSKFAYELAKKGDPCCKQIFREAGKELAKIANACIAQVEFGGPVPVSYSGGVFNSGELVLRSFRSHLTKDAVVVKPALSPSEGAVILAMMTAGVAITPAIQASLSQKGV